MVQKWVRPIKNGVLAKKSDVILDPFRPGVMEKLNSGPDHLRAENEKLIYARLSGFGQSGPLKYAPGHDINYIAQGGVLHSLRDDRGKPTPPVNLVADFAGGGMLLSTGIIAALFERTNSGKGFLDIFDIKSKNKLSTKFL